MSKALFLDRDGVINVDHGYVYQTDNFDFVDGIFDLVRTARALDFLIIIITNQSGIGRGYYSENDFWKITEWLKERFAAENCFIDEIYYCPHHPEAQIPKYRKFCDHRKPEPGMLLTAKKKYRLDMSKSVVVGDNVTDIQAGHKAGVS